MNESPYVGDPIFIAGGWKDPSDIVDAFEEALGDLGFYVYVDPATEDSDTYGVLISEVEMDDNEIRKASNENWGIEDDDDEDEDDNIDDYDNVHSSYLRSGATDDVIDEFIHKEMRTGDLLDDYSITSEELEDPDLVETLIDQLDSFLEDNDIAADSISLEYKMDRIEFAAKQNEQALLARNNEE